MALVYILWGLTIGVLMAAPLGPVNLICIRRTLAYNQTNGFIVGLGAAVADTIFGTIAIFGLSAALSFIHSINRWVDVIGGCVLILISINLWMKHPHLADVKDSARDRLKGAVGAFTLTLMNPMTILGFVFLFGALGLKDIGKNVDNAVALIIGLFLGSSLWWFTITRSASYMRGRLSDGHLRLINRVSAVIVASCGLWAIGKSFF